MERARGITDIIFVDRLPGTTPATVHKGTGELYIVKSRWARMTPDERLFMLCHEMGHVALQTSDEMAADKFAHDQYSKLGKSPRQSVYALSKALTEGNPAHIARVQAQLNRAIQYDRQNPKSKEMVSYTGNQGGALASKMRNYSSLVHNHRPLDIYSDEFEDMSERRKRKQDRKDKKLDARLERKEIKAEAKATKTEAKASKIEAKGEKKILTGQANLVLAEQGINARAGLAKEIFSGATKLAGTVGASIVGAKAVTALPGMLGGGQEGTEEGGGTRAENIFNTAAQTMGALGSKILQPSQGDLIAGEQEGALSASYRTSAPEGGFSAINPNGYPSATEPQKEQDKNQKMALVIGAVVVVGLILFFILKK